MNQKQYDLMNWEEIESIVYADTDRPFDILGIHKRSKYNIIQVFLPGAESVTANLYADNKIKKLALEKVDDAGFFAEFFDTKYDRYTLDIKYQDKEVNGFEDPYSFVTDIDYAKIKEAIKGKSKEAYKYFGCHFKTVNESAGYEFVVYAPNASQVSLVGDFNCWNKYACPMQRDDVCNQIFKLFVPGLKDFSAYKYAISAKNKTVLKNDPFGIMISGNNSLTCRFDYKDNKALTSKSNDDLQILEIDLFKLFIENKTIEKTVADILNNLKKNLYNAVSVLPFLRSESNGLYDITNPYSVNSFEDFEIFKAQTIIENINKAGYDVLLEVPVSYVSACESGLADFDFSCLFEDEDKRLGRHGFYNAMLYDYSNNFTKSYLFSNLCFWANEFAVSGFVFPNVGVMLYHDYNKTPGEYVTEEWNSTINSKGVVFLKEVNKMLHKDYSKIITVAQIYAYFPEVTGKSKNSLGFDYCLNTGATDEIIDFITTSDNVRRDKLDSFLMFTHFDNNDEKYIYPFSHNENNRNNMSLYDSMPGDESLKLSNLKMAYIYKHLIMGSQLSDYEIDNLEGADSSTNKYFSKFYHDFRNIYAKNKKYLAGFNNEKPFTYKCFENQVFTREYINQENKYIIVFNFSDKSFKEYILPVSLPGVYSEVFNSDEKSYGGSGFVNKKEIFTVDPKDEEVKNSLCVRMPSLSIFAFRYRPFTEEELEEIYQKKKKMMIKFVDEEKKKVSAKLDSDICELRKQADLKIKELEKLLEPYDR